MNIIINKNDNYNIKNICCNIENAAKSNKKTTIELINFDYIEVEEFIDDLLENLIWHLSLSDIEDFVEIKDYNNILIGRFITRSAICMLNVKTRDCRNVR